METTTQIQTSGEFIDRDSEKCLLGALILDWVKMDETMGKIQSEDFYYSCNGLIYATMQSLYGKIQKLDFLILADELRKQGMLEKAGGAAYIACLTDQVPTSSNIDYYISQIKMCKANREVKNISGEITENLASKLPANDIIEQAKKKLEEIQNNNSDIKVITSSELLVEANERIKYNIETRGEPRGITTGFEKLDGILGGGFRKKHLIVLAARPSIGKTAMALNMLENCAAKGYKSGFISLEMTTEELSNRLISQCSGVPQSKLISGFMSSEQIENWGHASDYLSSLPIFLTEKHGIGISDVCTIIRTMVSKYGVQIVFIDYLGLIKTGQTRMQLCQELGIFTETIRETAIAMNIPAVLLCQLNRNAEEQEPTLADLKGSGDIEQHADEVFMIHGKRESDPSNPEAERTLIIAKHRNGITGHLQMKYIGALTKFLEVA